MYIDPKTGKNVREIAQLSTPAELRELALQVAKDELQEDNVLRLNGYKSSESEYKFMADVLELGLEEHVYFHSYSRWIIFEDYWFFNRTGKWSTKGKNTYYQSKGFKDFVKRYLSTNWKYEKFIEEKV